jgi:hypothetical protein
MLFLQDIAVSKINERVIATNKKLKELRAARKAEASARRKMAKQTRVDRERKALLVGQAVLRRVERGEWDATDFRKMMDEALTRPVDRALFDLD